MTDSVSLGFLGPSVPSGSHLCAFYRGSSGRDEILMPLRPGRFSAEDMLDYWHQVVATTLSGGEYSFTRATGEMPSILDHLAGRAEFVRYEAKLNEFTPSFPQVIPCLYDLERFGAEELMDALAIHPVVVVDGMVHDNPYHTEPGKPAAGRE